MGTHITFFFSQLVFALKCAHPHLTPEAERILDTLASSAQGRLISSSWEALLASGDEGVPMASAEAGGGP